MNQQQTAEYNNPIQISSPMRPTAPLVVLLLMVLGPCLCQSPKTPTTACLCDTTTLCEAGCCCDSACPALTRTLLNLYGQCDDDGFGIPICDALLAGQDIDVGDLYSGLRTIYMVLRRLFCVYRANVVDPVSFYLRTATDGQVQSAVDSGVAEITEQLTLLPQRIKTLGVGTLSGLVWRSELGLCVKTNTIYTSLGTSGVQECRAFLPSLVSISINPYLSLQQILGSFPSLKIYPMSSASSLTSATLPSTTATSCTVGGLCSNVPRILKLYLSPSTNSVDYGYSYVVVGDVSDLADNSYVTVQYEYEFLNTISTNSSSVFANAFNVGYEMGTRLQLLKRTPNTQTYHKVENPFNLAYRDSLGNCATATTTNFDHSIITLELGRTQFYTCMGTESLLLDNLVKAVDYIGVMGSANDHLVDYIEIDKSAVLAADAKVNVLLTVLYVRVGLVLNPQYYVVKAVMTPITDATNEKTLFVEYQEVQTGSELHLPPPPTVDVYLPDDFLYPFYVAQ